jgi:PhnB protein
MKRAMPKRKPPRASDELARAVQAMIDDREAAPRVSPKLAPILRVAADLRGMPDAEFKARLKHELFGRARPTPQPKKSRAAKTSAAKERLEPTLAQIAAPTPAYIRQGFHSVTPYIAVDGASKMIDFLKRAFGAEETMRAETGDGHIGHAEVRIEGSMLELGDPSSESQPNPIALWLFVPDADAAYARAIEAGATSIHEPVDQDYGDREGSVKDPFGNHWYIGTHRAGAEPLPAELRNVTPYLHPKGTPRLIDFMREAFDAEEVFRAQDDAGTVHHAKIMIGDSIIAMGETHGPYRTMKPTLHLYVPDADRAYQRALEAGAVSVSEPANLPYGERCGAVRDSFGNTWYIATRLEALAPKAETHEAPRRYEQPGNIMPFMYIEGVGRAFDFYREVFGAREVHRAEEGGKLSHIQMAIGQTNVMLSDPTLEHVTKSPAAEFAVTPHSLGGSPLHLYVYVPDADAAYKRALDAGSKIVDPMEDKVWGDHCGGVQDPFGHVWFIATPIKEPPIASR